MHVPDGIHNRRIPKTGVGFPDLVLLQGRDVLWRELKTDKGRVSEAQAAWGAALIDAGEDWAVWRPKDWPAIEMQLRALGRHDDAG